MQKSWVILVTSPVIEKKVYDLLSKRKKDLSPSPD